MAEQKFTPGPWYVRRVRPEEVIEANFIDIVNKSEGKLSDYEDGWLVAEIDAEHPVDAANARLISQAPVMYMALLDLEWAWCDEGDYRCLLCYAYRDEEEHCLDCKFNIIMQTVQG